MLSSRRQKYYYQCQRIIDDIHKRVANGEFVMQEKCYELYGKSEYKALLHEIHLMNANLDSKATTPAMEWLYYSRYFENKVYDERRQKLMFLVSIFSALVAMASAFYTFMTK